MYHKKEEIESIGDFTVINQFGRNYLYYQDKRIGECIGGDYKERFGGLSGWIDKVKSRSEKRCAKIISIKSDLESEFQLLSKMIYEMKLIK